MLSGETDLLNGRRVAAIGTSLAAFAVIVGLGAAVARNDDGSKTFFLQRDAAPAGESERAEMPGTPVRLAQAPKVLKTQHVVRSTAPVTVAVKSAPSIIKPVSGPVTLLTDATLMRGDAVMTMRGIRIFTGAMAFPHRDTDFVTLGGVGGLPRSVSRTLLAMDSVPRG